MDLPKVHPFVTYNVPTVEQLAEWLVSFSGWGAGVLKFMTISLSEFAHECIDY